MTSPWSFCLLFCIFACFYDGVIGKGVHLSVSASWEETSNVFELAEAVSYLPADAIWRFLKDYPVSESSLSPQEKYEVAWERVKSFTTQDHHLSLIQYSVASRYYNPTISCHLNLAEMEFTRFEDKEMTQNCDPLKPFAIVQFSGQETLSLDASGAVFLDSEPTPTNTDHESSEEDKESTKPSFTFQEFISCDATTLQQAIDLLIENARKLETLSATDLLLLPNEHQKGSQEPLIRVFLYGDFTVPEYSEFQFLLTYPDIKTQGISVFVRFARSSINEGSSVSLQGYGVELALKNTEYRTIDDNTNNEDQEDANHEELDESEVLEGINFHRLINKNPELEKQLRELRNNLAESTEDIRQLKRWEMSDLSIQAAFAASNAEDAWKFLSELTGNFPSLATSLASVKVPDSFKDKLTSISKVYGPPGTEFALLNGRQLDLEELNPFELYSMIREEYELYDTLELMDIPLADINSLMRLDLPTDDSFRIDLRSEHILWLNDLEKDRAYAQWPETIYELFKPSYPDQLRFIRKNLINAVFVLKPLAEESFTVYTAVDMYINGKAPLRVAFLFERENSEFLADSFTEWSGNLSDVIIVSYNYLYHNKKPLTALSFLSSIGKLDPNDISLDDIQNALGSVSLQTIYEDFQSSGVENSLTRTSTFITNTGLSDKSPILFLNGKPMTAYPLTNQGITAAIKGFIGDEYTMIQRMLWEGRIDETTNIYDFVLSKGSYSIYNDILMKPANYHSMESITMPISNERKSFRMAGRNELGLGNFLLSQLDYVTGKHSDGLQMDDITHLLILDLSTQQALRTVIALAKRFDMKSDEAIEDTKGVRFAIIHNSGCLFDNEDNFEGAKCHQLYSDMINLAGRSFSTRKYLKFLQFVLPDFVGFGERKVDLVESIKEKVKPGTAKLEQYLALWRNDDWKAQVRMVHRHLLSEIFKDDIEAGRNYIITNGRLTKLSEDLEVFDASGFRLLEQMERKKTIGIRNIIENANYEHVIEQEPFQSISKRMIQFRSDLHMKASSVLLHRQQHKNRKVYTLPNKVPSSPIEFVFVLDPLSKSTRRLAPIVSDLLNTFGSEKISIDLIFNPNIELSELPLSSYYRYAIQTNSIDFDTEGFLHPHAVTFTNLPKQLLLSLNIDAPTSWMVQSLVSQSDLDNIVLADTADDFIFAEFVLRNLVIQGSVIDTTNPRESPRGTELILQDKFGKTIRDTIVMANLNYFQLQANPGVWFVNLSPGRSSKVYSMENNNKAQAIFISSFAMPYENILLRKNEEMKDVSVLDVPMKKYRRDQTIHVFSLASGHVYERFLKIMMLSVSRNTESPVKFWFVENFLSPQFKNILGELSGKYGFEVELISYQWPSWLLAQTEKQRVIWAYKILFLDVLFPLDVHRVIFVDADLVVRGDLRELNDLDMKGAPYGYTPFCDSREEMEGFRFWKTGFWQDHLNSMSAKYHISALYVVDLDKFRDNAVGDILRSVYNNLSKDPNSLANLDQDLPNFTQNNIPIYSLDQSWLWCETWCSDGSKETAKAIDLCNNPLTKTPKLENAVRIVDEWSELDQEARDVSVSKEKLREMNPIHELLARSVNDSWVNQKLFLQNFSTSKEVGKLENEEDEPASWFGDLMSDII